VFKGFEKYHEDANFCSGNDDEPSNNNVFIQCIDDVTQRYYEWKRGSDSKKQGEKVKEMAKNECEQVFCNVASGKVLQLDVASVANVSSKDSRKHSLSSSPVSSLVHGMLQ